MTPPEGAHFVAAMMGDATRSYLMASDAGYGFVTTLGELYAKNKNGKSIIRAPKGAQVMAPVPVYGDDDIVAAISNEGRLLVFPLAELPRLGKGKGVKIIGIPSARVVSREEYLVALAVVPQGMGLTVFAGQRHLNLKASDLAHYSGERGRRGSKLPRGFQRVDAVAVIQK